MKVGKIMLNEDRTCHSKKLNKKNRYVMYYIIAIVPVVVTCIFHFDSHTHKSHTELASMCIQAT